MKSKFGTEFYVKPISDFSDSSRTLHVALQDYFQTAAIGIHILRITPYGTVATAIMQKTTAQYGSYIVFGYFTRLVQYNYNNGIWTNMVF